MNATIITMATLSVASGVIEKILPVIGKTDEAVYVGFATKGFIATTALTSFKALVDALRNF